MPANRPSLWPARLVVGLLALSTMVWCAPFSALAAPKPKKPQLTPPRQALRPVPVAKRQKPKREYRFLVTGLTGHGLDLVMWTNGKQVCELRGRLTGKKPGQPTRLERACVIPGGTFADESDVDLRLEGTVWSIDGHPRSIRIREAGNFEDVFDAWIEVKPDSHVEVILAKG